MTSFLAGLSLGFSLIVAIGAQNAFVLKQGLRKQHVGLVCFICALSDALLIAIGVTGFSKAASIFPELERLARWGGILFLSAYAGKSFISALKQSSTLTPSDKEGNSILQTTLICLAFTWLNPHVYLDTVVLLGAVSTKYASSFAFAGGAICASFLFFFSLGYGARYVRPFFANATSWRILDTLIGIIMLLIAYSLLEL